MATEESVTEVKVEMTTLEKITAALQPMRPVLPDEARRWERKVSFLLMEVCRDIDQNLREFRALMNEYDKLSAHQAETISELSNKLEFTPHE